MDYDTPVRVAFCKVLFGRNGGRFTETGMPVMEDALRSMCDRAYDCGACPYLAEWIAGLAREGWSWGWECDGCLRHTLRDDLKNNINRHVQGFYQAGKKYGRTPEDPDYDPDRPGLEGCTRCGFESSFLQLVIRRKD